MWEINQNIEKTQDLDRETKSEYLDVEDLLKDIQDKLSNKDLSDLAKKELEEFKTRLKEAQEWYKKEKQDIIETWKTERQDISEKSDDNYIKQDLLDEFQDDLKALDIIEERFKNYKWYNEFITLLKSNDLSEQQKEDIYYLFLNNLSDIIGMLRWVLPTNKEQINILLDRFSDYIQNQEEKDFKELMDLKDKIDDFSIENLIYTKSKLERYKDKWKEVKLMIKDIDILLDIKKEEIVSKEQEMGAKRKEMEIKRKEMEIKRKEIETTNKKIKELKYVIAMTPNLLTKEFIKQDTTLSNLLIKLEDKTLDEKAQTEITKEIANYLKTPWVLANLLKQAKQLWKKEYKEFYDFALNIANVSWDDSLKQILSDYPSSINYIDLPRWEIKRFELEQYFSWDLSKVTTNWDKYFLDDEMLDYSKKPPTHFIFNKDTLYKLKIEDNQSIEIQRKATKMKEVYNKMYKSKVEELQIKDENKRLSSLLTNESELSKIAKNQWKDILTIKLEIQKKIQDNKNRIKELQKTYKKLKDEYISLSDDTESEEWKAEKRKILEFLHNSCFDVIPQEFTDKLINEIKLNSLVVSWLKLDPNRIDIANGNFGEAESEDNPTKWQENLIDFLNKMIYWEINPKESIIKKSSLIWPLSWNIDPEDFKSLLIKKWIMWESWFYFNIEKARENLSKIRESSL